MTDVRNPLLMHQPQSATVALVFSMISGMRLFPLIPMERIVNTLLPKGMTSRMIRKRPSVLPSTRCTGIGEGRHNTFTLLLAGLVLALPMSGIDGLSWMVC